MDPATILILLGAYYALTRGVKVARAASRGASKTAVPKSARTGGKAGGGMPAWLNRQRHTGSGWWAGEARHGFPVFRSGVREGWTQHQTAMAKRQAEVTKARADHTERQNTYRKEWDAHKARLDAARQEAERQKRERKAAAAAAAPAAAGSKPSATEPGHPVMAAPGAACTNPDCSCHATTDTGGRAAPRSPAPAATGSPAGGTATTGGTTVSDMSYETTQQTCDKIAAALDAAVNNDELKAAQLLADGIGPQLPDDPETLGHAGDLVSAIQAAQAAMAKAIEQAQALKASHEKNHGAAHEAAAATGHMAEREHHTAG